jgi:hypothetical protein
VFRVGLGLQEYDNADSAANHLQDAKINALIIKAVRMIIYMKQRKAPIT